MRIRVYLFFCRPESSGADQGAAAPTRDLRRRPATREMQREEARCAPTSDQGDAEGGGAMRADQRPGRCRGRRRDAGRPRRGGAMRRGGGTMREGGGAMRMTSRVGEMQREEVRCGTMTREMRDDRGMNERETRGLGKGRKREGDDQPTTTTKWRRDDDDEVEVVSRER
ncbi:hypothetical protein Syun_007385 [Stephania yunnanensis]|uniref:Uncharacterized protein n=1 Tax=Stephania yunnanensis TaxID=152371 RepID=A0AAP0L051_9MAGN